MLGIKKIQKRCFSLIEIMVSLAVFSVVLLLMINIFKISSEMWNYSRTQGAVFADSRLVLDTVEDLLRCRLRNANSYFGINLSGKMLNNTPNTAGSIQNTVMFFAKYDITNNMPGNFNFVMIGLYDNGVLKVKNVSSNADLNLIYQADDIATVVSNVPALGDTNLVQENELCFNVASFEVIPMKYNNGIYEKLTTANDYAAPNNIIKNNQIYRVPEAIIVKVTILTDGDYRKWNSLTGQSQIDFLSQNGSEFSRFINLQN